MPAKMSIEEKIKVKVAYTTHAGQPAVVDGVPVITLSSDTIAHVGGAMEPDPAVPNGWFGTVISDGMGDEVVTVTADADMGSGVKPIILSDTLTITGADAEGGVMGFDAPEPK